MPPAPTKELEVGVLKWVKVDKKPEEPHSVITATEVATEHGCPRNVLKTHLQREVEENQACWGLPFTLLLVISYSVVAVSHDNASILRAVEESMDHDLIENANFAFTGSYMGNKGIEDVNSVADFWSWMDNGLVPLVFIQSKSWGEGYDATDDWYVNASTIENDKRGIWLAYNRIVGGIRLRQERAGNSECTSVKDLRKVYDMPCDAGLGYELDPEIRSARFTGNPKREVWMYVFDDLAKLRNDVWELERTRWLDRNTMKVEIAIPSYNGELGLHVMIYVNFFFSRGGHIWKKLMPLSFTAQLHPFWYYWIGDFVWMFCVLYIFISECAEIGSVVKRKGVFGISEYMTFWNAFDWFSLTCAFAVMGMFGAVMNMVNTLNDSLEGLKDPFASGFNSTSYTMELHSHSAMLENTVQYVNNWRMVMASYPLIIILRLFKAYSSQPRLAMVTRTLETAGQELVEFFLVFFSVFITITISGVVLFGREVNSFSTLPRAFFASFRILIGDLMWDETSQVGRVFAFTWIALFMIVNVMLLLNMLLAIIMKHYVQAKDQAGNAQTLWSEAAQVFTRWRNERAGRCVPMEKILIMIDKLEKAEQLAAELEDEDVHIETDEELELRALGTVMTIPDLQAAYLDYLKDTTKEGKTIVELGDEQATAFMTAAVEEFYGQNHSAIDMEEVLKLTHKVECRTQKLAKMSRTLDKTNLCPNEIVAMSEFLKETEVFTDELRAECSSHRQEVRELRTLKRGLLLQLQTRQSLASRMGSGDEEDGPTSVSRLLESGAYPRYAWKLGARFSNDPHPEAVSEVDLDRGEAMGDFDDQDAPYFEHTDKDGGPTGPHTMTQTRQPRYAMDDALSDDDLRLDMDDG